MQRNKKAKSNGGIQLGENSSSQNTLPIDVLPLNVLQHLIGFLDHRSLLNLSTINKNVYRKLRPEVIKANLFYALSPIVYLFRPEDWRKNISDANLIHTFAHLLTVFQAKKETALGAQVALFALSKIEDNPLVDLARCYYYRFINENYNEAKAYALSLWEQGYPIGKFLIGTYSGADLGESFKFINILQDMIPLLTDSQAYALAVTIERTHTHSVSQQMIPASGDSYSRVRWMHLMHNLPSSMLLQLKADEILETVHSALNIKTIHLIYSHYIKLAELFSMKTEQLVNLAENSSSLLELLEYCPSLSMQGLSKLSANQVLIAKEFKDDLYAFTSLDQLYQTLDLSYAIYVRENVQINPLILIKAGVDGLDEKQNKIFPPLVDTTELDEGTALQVLCKLVTFVKQNYKCAEFYAKQLKSSIATRKSVGHILLERLYHNDFETSDVKQLSVICYRISKFSKQANTEWPLEKIIDYYFKKGFKHCTSYIETLKKQTIEKTPAPQKKRNKGMSTFSLSDDEEVEVLPFQPMTLTPESVAPSAEPLPLVRKSGKKPMEPYSLAKMAPMFSPAEKRKAAVLDDENDDSSASDDMIPELTQPVSRSSSIYNLQMNGIANSLFGPSVQLDIMGKDDEDDEKPQQSTSGWNPFI